MATLGGYDPFPMAMIAAVWSVVRRPVPVGGGGADAGGVGSGRLVAAGAVPADP